MNLMAVVEQRIKSREEAKQAAKRSANAALLNTQTILKKLPLSQGERKEFEASNLSLATKLEMLKSMND